MPRAVGAQGSSRSLIDYSHLSVESSTGSIHALRGSHWRCDQSCANCGRV